MDRPGQPMPRRSKADTTLHISAATNLRACRLSESVGTNRANLSMIKCSRGCRTRQQLSRTLYQGTTEFAVNPFGRRAKRARTEPAAGQRGLTVAPTTWSDESTPRRPELTDDLTVKASPPFNDHTHALLGSIHCLILRLTLAGMVKVSSSESEPVTEQNHPAATAPFFTMDGLGWLCEWMNHTVGTNKT